MITHIYKFILPFTSKLLCNLPHNSPHNLLCNTSQFNLQYFTIYFAILHNFAIYFATLKILEFYFFPSLTKLELPFAFPLSSSHSTLNFFSRYSLTGLTLSFSPLISVPTANFPSFLCFLYALLFFFVVCLFF